MQKQEVWALPYARIIRFFAEQIDVTSTSDPFYYKNCKIYITALPERSLGPMKIPQTRISLEGPEEDVTAIYQRFFLRFISAGG